MGENEWWKQMVVYQVYPKSFKDTNNDGFGDIKGVTEKLDYLQKLGIEAIWLNPVYRSPMVDNGYDISDYEAIDPTFGTMDDMEELIHEAKIRGIRIVMDLVLNHSSSAHPWFLQSRSSRTNPKRDWYIWRDPKPDGAAPTNWRSEFGGSSWTLDTKTGQYYLHTFAQEQPDLNWANSEVRAAIYKMINFWLHKGVGGFRLDAITYIKKPEQFTDLPADSADGLAAIGDATLNQPGLLDYLHELKDHTFVHYDIFTVAEAPGIRPEEFEHFTGPDGVFTMLIEFDHVRMAFGPQDKWYEPISWSLTDLKKVVTKSQNQVNQTGWVALYLENHDSPRSMNNFLGDDAVGPVPAKLLATFICCSRGRLTFIKEKNLA
ncbi:alpha-glucosidase [Sporolactobacillus sp. STCC-11]|uniref:alpha-glucosidase n=1 Tax=Sporolactobacillus caesalpiniae TaxID=3230362 RepID=UPI003391F513